MLSESEDPPVTEYVQNILHMAEAMHKHEETRTASILQSAEHCQSTNRARYRYKTPGYVNRSTTLIIFNLCWSDQTQFRLVWLDESTIKRI